VLTEHWAWQAEAGAMNRPLQPVAVNVQVRPPVRSRAGVVSQDGQSRQDGQRGGG
jgi:hypothetical protein